jgi:hypothetical protein
MVGPPNFFFQIHVKAKKMNAGVGHVFFSIINYHTVKGVLLLHALLLHLLGTWPCSL